MNVVEKKGTTSAVQSCKQINSEVLLRSAITSDESLSDLVWLQHYYQMYTGKLYCHSRSLKLFLGTGNLESRE